MPNKGPASCIAATTLRVAVKMQEELISATELSPQNTKRKLGAFGPNNLGAQYGPMNLAATTFIVGTLSTTRRCGDWLTKMCNASKTRKMPSRVCLTKE